MINKDEIDLESLSGHLTWFPYDKDVDPAPPGSVLKDSAGGLDLVGHLLGHGNDGGCGCCSENVDAVEIAYLSELIGEV